MAAVNKSAARILYSFTKEEQDFIDRLLEKLKSEDKIITEPMIIESLNLLGSCHGGNRFG